MALITKGQRYGRWTVLQDQQYTFTDKVLAQCDCGTKRKVRVNNLRIGRTNSCGCINKEILAAEGRKHRKHHINPGDVYGRLTVTDTTNRDAIICTCTCGNTATVQASALYGRTTRSCGCLKRETAIRIGKSRAPRGGASNSPLYNTWKRVARYPGTVHEPWRTDPLQFIKEVEAEAGPITPGMSLLTKDRDLGYIPGNIEWGGRRYNKNQNCTLTEQQRTEAVERFANGERQIDIAKDLGVSRSLIYEIRKQHAQDQ